MLVDRINDIRSELEIIDQTLNNIHNHPKADIFIDRLMHRIDILRDELCILYKKHYPVEFEKWSSK